MEIKKSKKAELEPHKGTWFAMGVIVVLAFMYIGFEWTEYDKKYEAASSAQDPIFELTLLPITYPEPPPAPPPPAPPVAETLVVVEGPEEVDNIHLATPEELGDAVDIKGYIPPPIEDDDDEVIESKIFVIVEQMPEFPGGTAAMLDFLKNSIKYPAVSIDNNSSGKVIVQFVVDTDGSINDLEIVRGVDPYLDKEALRVIRTMPKWKPGMQRNKAVRVKYTLPVVFRLQ